VLIDLRKVSTPATAPATGFNIRWWQYDNVTRLVEQSVTNAPTAANFELAVGALVPGASYCVGSTRREVRYNGNGEVYTLDAANSMQCVGNLSNLVVLVTRLTTIDAYDATIQVVFVNAGGGTVLASCGLIEPALADAEPFSQTVETTASIVQFPPENPGTTTAYASNGRDYRGPYRQSQYVRTGLGPGRYRVQVTEQATGFTLEEEVLIDSQTRTDYAPFSRTLLAKLNYETGDIFTNGPLTLYGTDTESQKSELTAALPAGKVLLRLLISGTSTAAVFTAWFYNTATGAIERGLIENTGYDLGVAGLNALEYTLPAGWPVGSYLGNSIVSDGRGNVTTLTPATSRRPRLANLIVTHPARPGESTGGLLIEVDMQMDPDCPPLEFTLYGANGSIVAVNETGCFDDLAAQTYRYTVAAPTAINVVLPLSANVTLTAAYGLRYELDFSDLRNNQAARLELWEAGYDGVAEPICGTAEVLSIDWQGLQAGPLQADMPSSVGATATIQVLAETDQLQQLFIGDRTCRADIYYSDVLRFRGYVRPDVYEAPLLSGKQAITLIATCGLGDLKTTRFAGGLSATTANPEYHSALPESHRYGAATVRLHQPPGTGNDHGGGNGDSYFYGTAGLFSG
jgi:hypothetical protein